MPSLKSALLCLLALTTLPAAAQEPNFGRALAITPSELLVGQPVNWYGPGTVYQYRLDGAGLWAESARLTAPDAARKDDFGRTIALEGNSLFIGAPRKPDAAGDEGPGVVFAYTRDAADEPWRLAQTIRPESDSSAVEFGASIVIVPGNPHDLFIGAPGAAGTGVVEHFRLQNGGWQRVATIRPAGASTEVAGFGASIAVESANRLIIGAPGSDRGAGRVYVAEPQSMDAMRIEIAPAPPERAGVGASVVVDTRADGRAYVGAPGAGVVVVLGPAGESAQQPWTPETRISVADALTDAVDDVASLDENALARLTRGAGYGTSVAVVDDELWVGAPGLRNRNGRVFRYAMNQGAASEARLGDPRPLDADSADGTHWPFNFGYTIAAAGDHAVVSMPQRDFGEGRVLALTHVDGNWQPSQVLTGEIHRIGSDLATGERCDAAEQIDEFPCRNIELVAHLPVSALGGARGAWVNDVWGWTDPETGRDYALVSRRDGASFVDLTDPANPRVVGDLPRTEGTPPSVWRDIKVIGNYAFIVSDGARDHGMQVFDLTRLRGVTDGPEMFTPDATYRGIHSAHNVVADTASGFVYIVGSNGGGETCGGGLHMVDVREPLNPTFAGCYHSPAGAEGRGYTHDAQCLVYQGVDERYRGRQICIGSNETEINIADVTDKDNPQLIGRGSYPNVAYAHQGWFDDEQRYFYMNDEGDELAGLVDGTRTIVWDLTQLDDPVVAHEYIGPVASSDHNLYVKGDRVYMSNYGSGFRVLDISDRETPREVAYFDSAPYNRNGPGHSASQSGAWSNYPFFDSGVVVFTSVREGLFVVRVVEPVP